MGAEQHLAIRAFKEDRMNRRSINRKAFTLVEVLVAMVVLAIGLLGLAGITVVVLRSNTLSQQISQATSLASSLMEDLRGRDNLPDCSTNTISVTPGSGACKILEESGLASLGDNAFLPSPTNENCGVEGLLSSGNTYTFDNVSGNSVTRYDFANNLSICDLSSTASFQAGPYIRYYKTTQPGADDEERKLVTVVLWKDKFGKWRHVRLDTRKSTN